MKTTSCLSAELTDLLKELGKLNSISLELQFQGHNVIEFRKRLKTCIGSAALGMAISRNDPSTKEYKSLANGNLLLTNTLLTIQDLELLTKETVTNFKDVYLAYKNDYLTSLFISLQKLCHTITVSSR